MTEEIKSVKDETIDEESLPELVQWSKIGGRPTSLRDLSVSDADKLDNVPETGDFGNLAWEDVADEIHIKTGAITETKISDNSISTPKLQTGSVTSAKVTTGELITLSAQIRDAIINNAHIDNLSADKITAGTLTGRTVRTASSGKRVEILSDLSNKITLYDEENKSTTIESFYTGAGHHFGLYYDTGHYLEFGGDFETILATPNGDVRFQYAGFYFGNDLLPNTNETLGNSSYRWAGVYTDYLRSYGDARVDDNLTVYGTTTTKNLGVTGFIILSGIPTSDPGSAGVVYRDGNDLRISTG